MATAWSDVASSDAYQKLAPEQQEAARNQYFEQVVAPQVPRDKLDVVRNQFDASTKKKAPDTDTKEKPSAVSKYASDYGSGVKDATTALGEATKGDGTVTGAVKATAKTALGAGETALGMAGGIAGDVVGAVTSTATQNASTGAKIRDAITQFTAPRTAAGKAVAGEVGAVTKPIGDVLELLPKYLEEHGHGVAAQDLRAVLDVAGGEEAVAGKGIKAAVKDVSKAGIEEIKKQVDAERSPEARQADVNAQKAGLTLDVSKARPSLFNRLGVGLTGDKKFRDAAAAKNTPVIQDLIRKGLGIKEGVDINADSLREVREQAHDGYENLKNLKPTEKTVDDPNVIKPSQAYFEKIKEIAAPFQKPVKATEKADKTGLSGASGAAFKVDEPGFKRSTTHPIEKLAKDLRESKSYTTTQALDKIKELRETADIAYRAGNQSLGKAAKALAANLEDSIGQHLEATGQPAKILKDFQKSREVIAKSYTVQKAIDKNGFVDARKLAAEMRKKPGRLTDELKQAAEFAQHNEEVATPKSAAPNPLSAHDAIAATLATGAKGLAVGAKTLGVAALKPITRKVLTSDFYQKRGGRALTAAEEAARRIKSANRGKKLVRGGVRTVAGAGVADEQISAVVRRSQSSWLRQPFCPEWTWA